MMIRRFVECRIGSQRKQIENAIKVNNEKIYNKHTTHAIHEHSSLARHGELSDHETVAMFPDCTPSSPTTVALPRVQLSPSLHPMSDQ